MYLSSSRLEQDAHVKEVQESFRGKIPKDCHVVILKFEQDGHLTFDFPSERIFVPSGTYVIPIFLLQYENLYCSECELSKATLKQSCGVFSPILFFCDIF